MEIVREFHSLDFIAAIIVAFVFILLSSLIKEPSRKQFMAIMVSGAGAAYLNGGLGIYEFVFTTIVTYLAFKGLNNYFYIGIAWLMHTGWDIIHHLYGNPIVPFVSNSSGQCAVTDALIAVWFFFNAPSIYQYLFKLRVQEKNI